MYSIVQMLEEEEFILSVLPTKWTVPHGWEGETNSLEGQDLCFWPSSIAGYGLLEMTKSNPDVAVDENKLMPHRCKIKRFGLQTYVEATRQLKAMETTSGTDGFDTGRTSAKGKEASVPAPEAGNPQLNLIISLLHNLNEKVNTLQTAFSTLQKDVAQNRNLLSRANAKIDSLAGNSSTSKESTPKKTVNLKKVSIAPVQSFEELTALEEMCKDEEFVKSVVKSIGRKMGKNLRTGDGATVCLRVIDDLLSREFLTKCSWTGVSRTRAEDGSIIQKYALQRYEGVIDLFYQIVVYSDPLFTTEESSNFLRRCVQNSRQRFAEVKGVRSSSSRKRRKRKLDVNTTNDGEESTDEENGSNTEEERYDSNNVECGNADIKVEQITLQGEEISLEEYKPFYACSFSKIDSEMRIK